MRIQSKNIIIINSLLAFISAFIFVKGVIAISRFFVLKFFGSTTNMINFDIVSMDTQFSPIWTYKSVISIYLIGFIVALFLVFISYHLYRYFRTRKGTFKLWFNWVYFIALIHSLGLFIRDIPLKRDFYHALNWMHMPYWLMITLTILSGLALIYILSMNEIKFLRLVPSFDFLQTNKSRRKFYFVIAVLPALLGSLFLIILQINTLELYVIIELIMIVIGIFVPYFMLLFNKMIVLFRIIKGERPNFLSGILVVLFVLSIISYYYFKTTYY